jgi:pimeloyl-ACP methyl ester carboxylesterase
VRFPLIASFIALFSLVEAAALLVQPAASAAVTPVGLDPACASSLAARLADDDVRVLGCDPAGRGRAVVALGDPATAPNVVVLVPGADIDLATLDDPVHPDERPFGWARALHASAEPGTAVVLWVGYPTPQGIGRDSATGRLARAAVPALAEEVAALHDRPLGPPHLTVIGHSYGAVVVTLAAHELETDDLVLLASPGARVDDVADLHTGARVFAARGPDDWIRFVPHLEIGDLGHGADPVDPSFGAVRLPADDVVGHDGYFRAGTESLAAMAAVVSSGVRS